MGAAMAAEFLPQDPSPEALRVIGAAAEPTGDANNARCWYCAEPLLVFNRRTAAQLVADGRIEDVLCYFRSPQAGAAG